MNKKQAFIDKLIQETESNQLEWLPVRKSTIKDYTYNIDQILRLYSSSVNDKEVILIERKEFRFIYDIDDYVDTQVFEVLIISDYALDFIIDNSFVTEESLFRLFEIVSEKATKIDDFIESYLSMNS